MEKAFFFCSLAHFLIFIAFTYTHEKRVSTKSNEIGHAMSVFLAIGMFLSYVLFIWLVSRLFFAPKGITDDGIYLIHCSCITTIELNVRNRRKKRQEISTIILAFLLYKIFYFSKNIKTKHLPGPKFVMNTSLKRISSSSGAAVKAPKQSSSVHTSLYFYQIKNYFSF